MREWKCNRGATHPLHAKGQIPWKKMREKKPSLALVARYLDDLLAPNAPPAPLLLLLLLMLLLFPLGSPFMLDARPMMGCGLSRKTNFLLIMALVRKDVVVIFDTAEEETKPLLVLLFDEEELSGTLTTATKGFESDAMLPLTR